MITKVSIENLRGIRSGELGGLSPVSVLVGPNNAGKSTCLEAIAMASLGSDVRAVVDLVRRRGGSVFGALRHVVTSDAQTSLVQVVPDMGPVGFRSRFSIITDWRAMEYQIALQEGLKPPFLHVRLEGEPFGVNSMFVDSVGGSSEPIGSGGGRSFTARLVDVGTVRSPRALEDAYTAIERAGRLPEVLKGLSASMPGLVDLRILKEQDEEFVLHTFSSDGSRVPTYLAGDGFKRLLELAAALADVQGGVALLEEPECYQHPRYLREVVALIRAAADSQTQVILSTHSIELLDALLHADWPAESTYPTVHRIRLDCGELKSTVLSREQALVARDELVEDLRA